MTMTSLSAVEFEDFDLSVKSLNQQPTKNDCKG